MKTENTRQDEILTRYILGNLPNEERERIEERFLQDDALFEEMLALENELMYDYTQGNLTPQEAKLFEQKFLASKEDKQKAIFANAFLKTIDDFALKMEGMEQSQSSSSVSFWKSFSSLFSFQSPLLQFGMSAAMLLFVIGGVWLFIKNNQLKNEVATLRQSREQNTLNQQIAEKQKQKEQLEQQLAQEKRQSEQNQQRINKLEEERAKLEKELKDARQRQIPDATQPQNRTSVFATLIPGAGIRSGGKEMQTIKLTQATKSIFLNLKLKTQDVFQTYTATVKTLDEGTQVWKSPSLKARGKGKNKTLSFRLPTDSLQNADYEITLEGVNENGQSEPIEDYYFRVKKRN